MVRRKGIFEGAQGPTPSRRERRTMAQGCAPSRRERRIMTQGRAPSRRERRKIAHDKVLGKRSKRDCGAPEGRRESPTMVRTSALAISASLLGSGSVLRVRALARTSRAQNQSGFSPRGVLSFKLTHYPLLPSFGPALPILVYCPSCCSARFVDLPSQLRFGGLTSGTMQPIVH
jgi:hypothetical protein